MVMPAIPIIVRIMMDRSRTLFVQEGHRAVVVMMMVLIDRDRRRKVRGRMLIPRRGGPGQGQRSDHERRQGAEGSQERTHLVTS